LQNHVLQFHVRHFQSTPFDYSLITGRRGSVTITT